MKDWLKYIFPYRTHLENEIEYLKAQLAQKQRRIDEMMDAINRVALKKAEPVERKQAKAVIPVQPKGWDAYRASRRLDGDTEETEENVQYAEKYQASNTA